MLTSSIVTSTSSIVAWTSSHGATNRATVELLQAESDIVSLSCAAHELKLCVEEGLSVNAISHALAAARKLAGHFNHSPLATSVLRKRQKSTGSPALKLQHNCPTRWNSQFYMTKTLLQCRWPVSAVHSNETVTKKQYCYLDLSSENWLVLEKLVKVLEPFEIVIVVLSKETNISLSTVLPIVHGLKRKMIIDEDDSPVARQFKAKIVVAVEKRWNLASFVPTEVSVLATVLDPWFQQFSFWTEEQKDQVRAALLLQKPVQKKDTEDTETPSPKKKKNSIQYSIRRRE